jgi:hypothetical protein
MADDDDAEPDCLPFEARLDLFLLNGCLLKARQSFGWRASFECCNVYPILNLLAFAACV